MKRIASVLLAASLAACGAAASPAADPDPSSPRGVALVRMGDRLAAVGFGPGTKFGPRWSHPAAAAAPDGSAVFAALGQDTVGARLVLRVEPRTGEITGDWTVPGAPVVDAVAPDGRWVALTEWSPATSRTTMTILEPATGAMRRHVLDGRFEAEAFTTEGEKVFALRHFEHHYRVVLVHTGFGALAQQFPLPLPGVARIEQVLSREKVPGGDMTGAVVTAVLTPDRTVLATLYRNPSGVPGHPGHEGSSPAFVHLADLDHQWTYCIDLPAPFGTGPRGDDVIGIDGDDVVVGARASGAVARIGVAALHDPVVQDPPPPTTYAPGEVVGAPFVPITPTFTPGAPLPFTPDLSAVEGIDRIVVVLPD
jgi:hypothetical protein